ncbi:MAG: hypothetical protein HQK81_06345 [Desulfovibrionaceae bacterium]|nr:hypothetical protein [Desulfovibrionaceae bacterium]MBF0513669.1 hypothetical protein [Desulfovibrionaceae bacterium]
MKSREVRAWLVRKGLRNKDVAEALGCDSSLVSHFLSGRKKSKRVAKHLAGLGCPAKLLGIKEAA